MQTPKRIRLGLIGAGWMGRHHAANIQKNPFADLVAAADPSPANLAALCQGLEGDPQPFQSYEELLQTDIDAVVIASPNQLHAEQCIAAAKAGKHIYCEKPMANTLPQCRQVRDAVQAAGVKYLIGYHRRLNPLYQHAKHLLDAGQLGRLFLAESDYIHHIPAQADIWSWLGREDIAGSLFHAGSGHNVDLLRFFCGEIVEVTGMKDIFLPRTIQVETEDSAVILFRFASGAIGKVHFCVGPVCPFQFNLRLFGTQGTLLNNQLWLDSTPRFDNPAHARDSIEFPASWIPDNVQGGISETWDKLMNHFIAMLGDNVPSLNGVESAYGTSQACFAAMQAATSHQTISLGELSE